LIFFTFPHFVREPIPLSNPRQDAQGANFLPCSVPSFVHGLRNVSLQNSVHAFRFPSRDLFLPPSYIDPEAALAYRRLFLFPSVILHLLPSYVTSRFETVYFFFFPFCMFVRDALTIIQCLRLLDLQFLLPIDLPWLRVSKAILYFRVFHRLNYSDFPAETFSLEPAFPHSEFPPIERFPRCVTSIRVHLFQRGPPSSSRVPPIFGLL